MKYVAEFYHWARCAYLAQYGVPLDAFEFAYRFTVLELGVIYDLTSGKYLGRMAALDHHLLTPGEQYRQHIQSGGYRP